MVVISSPLELLSKRHVSDKLLFRRPAGAWEQCIKEDQQIRGTFRPMAPINTCWLVQKRKKTLYIVLDTDIRPPINETAAILPERIRYSDRGEGWRSTWWPDAIPLVPEINIRPRIFPISSYIPCSPQRVLFTVRMNNPSGHPVYVRRWPPHLTIESTLDQDRSWVSGSPSFGGHVVSRVEFIRGICRR